MCGKTEFSYLQCYKRFYYLNSIVPYESWSTLVVGNCLSSNAGKVLLS